MQEYIAGWDIGGAHLKAALINQVNEVLGVYQQPCEMWKGLAKLVQAFQAILQKMQLKPNVHVVTMTGELADIFANRDDGVRQILAEIQQLLPQEKLIVYAGEHGFFQISDITANHFASIASANWLASATLAARQLGSGVFVDIGSTTTDLLAFAGGKVLMQGYSDYERLISKELVYTGIVRTPLMAVSQSVQDGGREVGLMAEYFATMADVYRLTGELVEQHDQTPAADGGEKTISASATRIARMLGCDYYDKELSRWRDVARYFRYKQMASIQSACSQQLTRVALSAHAPVIGAGIGRFLARELAQNLGRPYVDFSGLFPGSPAQKGLASADCAPAAAVAALYLKEKLP